MPDKENVAILPEAQQLNAMQERIQQLLNQLNQDVFEKEEAIGLTFLSAIAGESIFLLGRPGVAKSLIARRLKFAFEGANSFEYLMNRFSTPDEIFGPVSISKLKESDTYERIVTNYLPDADVVFLDEIWKAGAAIQNSLLTVINEKIYRNGQQEIKVKLKALVAASNELPEKGQGLAALWDRFLLRYQVEGVQNQDSFEQMLTQTIEPYKDHIAKNIKITPKEYVEWSKEITQIHIPKSVLHTIQTIRQSITAYSQQEEREDLYISDRRWLKIVRLLRASAFLNGRKAVDLKDCLLIGHCLWNRPEQIDVVQQLVQDAVSGNSSQVSFTKVLQQLQIDFITLKERIEKTLSVEQEVQSTQKYSIVYSGTRYYYINNLMHPLIKVEEFNHLQKSTHPMTLQLLHSNYKLNGTYVIQKAKGKRSLIINGHEYFLKTEQKMVKKKLVRPMQAGERKQWTKEIDELLINTADIQQKIRDNQHNMPELTLPHLFVTHQKITISRVKNSELLTKIKKFIIKLRAFKHTYGLG